MGRGPFPTGAGGFGLGGQVTTYVELDSNGFMICICNYIYIYMYICIYICI
jgi:hypothetical protein